MYIKKGVSIAGLQAPMVLALLIISDFTGGDFTITGGTEPHPARLTTSLHPKGLALDIRLPKDPEQSHQYKSFFDFHFKDTEFDLVYYDTHVHIEFDPK